MSSKAIYEDIFGGSNDIEVIMHCHEKAISDFNKQKRIYFNQKLNLKIKKSYKCI